MVPSRSRPVGHDLQADIGHRPAPSGVLAHREGKRCRQEWIVLFSSTRLTGATYRRISAAQGLPARRVVATFRARKPCRRDVSLHFGRASLAGEICRRIFGFQLLPARFVAVHRGRRACPRDSSLRLARAGPAGEQRMHGLPLTRRLRLPVPRLRHPAPGLLLVRDRKTTSRPVNHRCHGGASTTTSSPLPASIWKSSPSFCAPEGLTAIAVSRRLIQADCCAAGCQLDRSGPADECAGRDGSTRCSERAIAAVSPQRCVILESGGKRNVAEDVGLPCMIPATEGRRWLRGGARRWSGDRE